MRLSRIENTDNHASGGHPLDFIDSVRHDGADQKDLNQTTMRLRSAPTQECIQRVSREL